MKKTYFWKAIVLFAGVLAIGCNKEQDTAEETNQEQKEVELVTETIKAVADEGSTKAQIAEETPTFTWSTGDRVAVRTNEGWFLSNALTEAGVSATFTVSYSGTREAFAIFPSSLVFEDAGHVYSNSSKDNGSGSNNLTVNLPSSYALADVSGDKAPCPMIATNTAGEGWEFKHLCGLLRLTINGIPTDATTLTLDFLGRKMSGAFTIANGNLDPGNESCVIASDSGADKITITDLSGETSVTVNIPLPTGTYDDIVVTSNSTTKRMAVRHIKELGFVTESQNHTDPRSIYTAQRAHRRKLTATLVSFTVGGGKKVAFSPGNLVATVTAMDGATPREVRWDFQGHPSYMVYHNVLPNYYNTYPMAVGTKIDFFAWGTSGWNNTANEPTWVNYQPWSIGYSDLRDGSVNDPYALNMYGYGPASNCYKAYNDDGARTEWETYAASQKGLWGEYENGDWGVYNQIGSYPAGTWRTPRMAEWDYLINERVVNNSLTDGSGNGARYVMLRVGGNYRKRTKSTGTYYVNMDQYLVIFPDDYVQPDDVTITPVTGGSVPYNTWSAWGARVGSAEGNPQTLEVKQAAYALLDKMEAAGAAILRAAGGFEKGEYQVYDSGAYWTSDAEINPRGSWSVPECDDDPKGEATRFVFVNVTGNQNIHTWGGVRHKAYSVRVVRDL